MKSQLHIKDLNIARELDGKARGAIRGGTGNQANATEQSNAAALLASVGVGNGSVFGGGPVIFQVESNPTQTLSNTNTSTNEKALSLIAGFL